MMHLKLYRKLKSILRYACYGVFFMYLLIPVIYHYSSSLQRFLIFRHSLALPPGLNFSHPEREILFGTYNRYISSSSSGFIGMWQVLPNDIFLKENEDIPNKNKDQWFIEKLTDDRPVVLYCHGNKPSRALDHRVLVLKLLQNLNYHAITFDYRGFADSSHINPNEETVTTDVLDVIKWIRLYSSGPLFVWSHSLGTGISLSALAKFCSTGACIDALILQSAFSSIKDEVESQTLIALYKVLPFYEWIFVDPLYQQDIVFDSQTNILNIQSPILFLHAEDDVVVPFTLGKKLFETARSYQTKHGSVKVKFVPFSADYGYGHNGIVTAPELPMIVKKFFDDSLNLKSSL